MKRFANAVKLFVWAWKHPQVIQVHIFEVLSSLLNLIMQVAAEGRPMMSKLATVAIDGEKSPIVSIWVGPSASSSPTERIAELLRENEELRAQLLRK